MQCQLLLVTQTVVSQQTVEASVCVLVFFSPNCDLAPALCSEAVTVQLGRKYEWKNKRKWQHKVT